VLSVATERDALRAKLDALEAANKANVQTCSGIISGLEAEKAEREKREPALIKFRHGCEFCGKPQCNCSASAGAQPREPMTDEEIRAAFGKRYPQDLPLIELAENNRDYVLESIGARHHFAAFKAAIAAAETHHKIGASRDEFEPKI
jgi:hypothetical protein